jgi:undecaprenyldiphospho-muramoylpentapeptide beta-N-acetylglucosaminyltransferase
MVAGGGTAGHLLPGIAVANDLVARGHAAQDVHFVGAERGPEATAVPGAGFGITLLPGRGIQRKLTPANVAAVWGLLRAVARAVALVRRERPAVVLVLGGYASAACALAAVLWRVPMVVADQNARAGAVNRLAGRFAAACAVPFDSTDLPRAVVTGNPVRARVLDRAAARDPRAARAALGIPEGRTVVGVFAGSLGSRRINEATAHAVCGAWAGREDLAVYHVLGARDWDDRPEVPAGEVAYRAVRYEEHMELVLDAADVVVCRAGGTTVAELAVMGTPALLVPLPIATRDHQRANALELVGAGAAVLVDDAELDAGRLVGQLDRLIAEPGLLTRMGQAARGLGRPDAAAAVADLLERHAR